MQVLEWVGVSQWTKKNKTLQLSSILGPCCKDILQNICLIQKVQALGSIEVSQWTEIINLFHSSQVLVLVVKQLVRQIPKGCPDESSSWWEAALIIEPRALFRIYLWNTTGPVNNTIFLIIEAQRSSSQVPLFIFCVVDLDKVVLLIFRPSMSWVLLLLRNLQWNDTFFLQWPQNCHDNNNKYQPPWKELKWFLFHTNFQCSICFTMDILCQDILPVWYLWTLLQLMKVLVSRSLLLSGGGLYMCYKCFARLNILSKKVWFGIQTKDSIEKKKT